MDRFPTEITDHLDDRVVTRFPPEPNGRLHLGHLRALSLDFGLADAARKKGREAETYLRFDDTNPAAESADYTEAIIDELDWLGFKPTKITYSSDYFDRLFELALVLIDSGHAYVCEHTPDEIKKMREAKKPSAYRDRTPTENRELFLAWRTSGGTTDRCLRMRGDLGDPDPCMWDLVFYRAVSTPHHRTGDRWKIYPTYDFTHAIVDSLEGITHSMCSTEFLSRRKSYFWLLEKLGLRAPVVYEFGKLSIERSVMSKRSLRSLIETEIVSGWDDPRLMTIAGLRRRGYPAEVLRRVIDTQPCNRIDATLTLARIDHAIREHLNQTAVRRMGVIEPFELTICDLTDYDSRLRRATLYDFPPEQKRIEAGEEVPTDRRGTRETHLTSKIYIERSSFRLDDEKSYYGLAPHKTVRLKYSEFVKAIAQTVSIDHEPKNAFVEITVPEKPKKVKGVLNWVNSLSHEAIFYRYTPLVRADESIDADSVLRFEGRVEESLGDPDGPTVVQFERLGYFIREPGSLEFHEIVPMRSSYS